MTMPDPTSTETIRLHDPHDLLTAVPYLLGFQPDRCIVVLALDDVGQLLVTARVELPTLDEASDAAGGLVRAFRHIHPTELLVVGYGYREAAPTVVAFEAALPWPARDLLLVDGDHWWGLSCPEHGTCCPVGEPFDKPRRRRRAAAGHHRRPCRERRPVAERPAP
jgi:hypothetical protein